jgi:hypothetical protein
MKRRESMADIAVQTKDQPGSSTIARRDWDQADAGHVEAELQNGELTVVPKASGVARKETTR